MARDRRYEKSGVGQSTGIVQMNDSNGDSVNQKIPVQGRDFLSLTTIEDNGGSGTVEIKGTNNPDTSDNNGETLVTNSHTGNDQQDSRARVEGYDYVFVDQTSSGGTENFSDVLLKLVE